MWQHLGILLAEHDLEARECKIGKEGSVAGLYVQCWNNCLNSFKQRVRKPHRLEDDHVEKLWSGSRGNSKSRNSPTSPSDVGDDAGAGPSSA